MTKLLDLKPQYIWGIILVFCIVGVYATTNNVMTVVQMLLFGLLGLGFRRVGVPAGPVVLGFILGPLAEANLRRALLIDDVTGFLTRPIAIVLIVLAIASLVWPMVRDARSKRTVASAEGLVE
jgi:putative tricarboxylic transport membrane protein